VTREAGKTAETARAIEQAGGVAVVFPTIAVGPPADAAPLDQSMRDSGMFDVIVVSSRTGADVLAGVAARVGADLAGARIAAVGQGSAAQLRAHGIAASIVPDREDGQGLLDAILRAAPRPGRALVLRAEEGREVLVDGLRAAGWEVASVVAYRTVVAERSPAEVEALLAAPRPDAALFMSPSAFSGLLRILGADAAVRWLAPVLRVAIGSVTAEAMTRAGAAPDVVASSPSVRAALDDIAAALYHPPVGR